MTRSLGTGGGERVIVQHHPMRAWADPSRARCRRREDPHRLPATRDQGSWAVAGSVYWNSCAGTQTPQKSQGSCRYGFLGEALVPTTPPPGWYEPEVSIEKVRPLIDLASPSLEEVVRYGLALLARASVTARGGDEHAALFRLYHHCSDDRRECEFQLSGSDPHGGPLLCLPRGG